MQTENDQFRHSDGMTYAKIPTLTPDHVLQLLAIDFESFRQQIVGILDAQLHGNRPDVAPVAVHRRHLALCVAAAAHRLEHQLIERRQKRRHDGNDGDDGWLVRKNPRPDMYLRTTEDGQQNKQKYEVNRKTVPRMECPLSDKTRGSRKFSRPYTCVRVCVRYLVRHLAFGFTNQQQKCTCDLS